MKAPNYKSYEKPKEIGTICSSTQIAYYCPECGDTIVIWNKNDKKPNIPKYCGHCFCPVFDPVDDVIADINKAIAESGEENEQNIKGRLLYKYC